MNTSNDSADGLFASRDDCRQALRTAIAEAANAGCRELFFCDADYVEWPLGEIAVIADLTRWAYAHRKLTLLARSFDELPRRHPRWMQWRRQWSHVVECRALEEVESGQLSRVLLADGVVAVRIFDLTHHRGAISRSAADLIASRENVDALLQRSVETFPPTILGL